MADRRRLRAIRDRLRREYGRPVLRPHRAPVDELVLTVLSQNTNDRNRDVAYARLRERFSSWAEVRDAPVEEVEEAIRPGGLAPTKAVRIKQILERARRRRPGVAGGAPLEEAREYLCDLPGRGPQDGRVRAAVLVRPARRAGGHARVPRGHAARAVAGEDDRSSGRTTRCCGSCARREDAYEIHVLLIRHGRRTCTARNPAARRARSGGCARTGGGGSPSLRGVSETTSAGSRSSALIAIAAVWGLTLRDGPGRDRASCRRWRSSAYRFIPAALIVAWCSTGSCARCPPDGWRAGLADGRLPHRRLHLPDARASRRRPRRTRASSPACSSCSRRCSARSSCASASR